MSGSGYRRIKLLEIHPRKPNTSAGRSNAVPNIQFKCKTERKKSSEMLLDPSVEPLT